MTYTINLPVAVPAFESMAIVSVTVNSPRFPEERDTGIEFVPESSVKVNSVEKNPRTLISENIRT